MGVDELGELKTRKIETFLSCHFQRADRPHGRSLSAYRPRLVAHVVDGRKGVDARDSSVLQPDDQVPEIFVLGHAEGVLADEHKVGLEGPGGRNQERMTEDICGD